MVAVPVTVAVAGAIALFVNLSIAPILKDVDQNAAAIRELRAAQVPRIEHEKDWTAQKERDDRQDARIDEVRKDFGNAYSIRDAVQDLKGQVDDLRKKK